MNELNEYLVFNECTSYGNPTECINQRHLIDCMNALYQKEYFLIHKSAKSSIKSSAYLVLFLHRGMYIFSNFYRLIW